MNQQVYSASNNHESLPVVKGPGKGLGYYAHTLNPHLTCESKEEAERTAQIANIAYSEGYKQAQRDMQKALGIFSK